MAPEQIGPAISVEVITLRACMASGRLWCWWWRLALAVILD
jgi:hypothetical protein